MCAARPGSPDHADYLQVRQRLGGKRAALSVARKLARKAYHTLSELGDQALVPAELATAAGPEGRRPGRPEAEVQASRGGWRCLLVVVACHSDHFPAVPSPARTWFPARDLGQSAPEGPRRLRPASPQQAIRPSCNTLLGLDPGSVMTASASVVGVRENSR
jgi:hypothetical protein